jgi:hypothetical protein
MIKLKTQRMLGKINLYDKDLLEKIFLVKLIKIDQKLIEQFIEYDILTKEIEEKYSKD